MKVLLLVGLIVLNGLFAMSEIALVAAKTSRLKRLAEKHRSAQIALQLKDDPTIFLSTIQIGITVIGLLSGIVGEATLSAPLAQSLISSGMDSSTAEVLSTLLVVVGITYFAIVVGELVPKRFAQSRAESIAVLVALPIYWLSRLTKPFVFALSISTETILKLFGDKSQGEEVTEDDIHALVKEGSESGAIEQGEQEMIRNILQLDDRLVSSLMTPRRGINYLNIDKPMESTLKQIRATKHSVFPLCRGNLGEIIGTVSAKSMLNDDRLTCQSLVAMVKQPVYVPESMKALHLLTFFKQTGAEMAFIVDEYGDIQGLVTHYDVLEAIAGELSMEKQDLWSEKLEDGSLVVDALIPLSELKNRLDLSEIEGEDEGFQTLNGMLTWLLGHLPAEGEVVHYQQWQFEVLKADSNRIIEVRVLHLMNTTEQQR
ncbi:hemolysin family protein [Vibrio maerlii]|uniref:hemolysin family protein n=1 Tax=Vibrio maerlii TaxID=2231648 RepID=UPI000E3BB2AA|nr:hemolysin family protein [Vibrio maerlii]